MATLFLMYHELEVPGRPLCREEKGYVRYVIPAATFRRQLEQLRGLRLRGVSVGEALAATADPQPRVAVTFDDGSETDLLVAAPLLREFGFTATFYVVAGFVGRCGYLSESQLRELADAGLEVGCHSMSHAFLTDLDAAGLRVEVAEAKERLEQMLGRPVEHFSCPGGRWSPRVARAARDAGFRSVATSRIGKNAAHTDPFNLARVAVQRGTSAASLDRLCRGRGLWRLWLRNHCLAAAKGLLGNRFYDRFRAAVLGHTPVGGTT
jgi:peptidoglycan/xylan/chitin deacetylase (PgdA/CDA1 family)